MRKDRPVTEPVPCRSCRSPVLWVTWVGSGKRMPIDAQPDPAGRVVVILRKGPPADLVCETYAVAHGPDRHRYTSHFSTCPQSGQWRRDTKS